MQSIKWQWPLAMAHKPQANKVFMVVPNTWVPSAWKVLHVALLTLRILRWHLDSLYMCGLVAFLKYIQQENTLVSFTAVITNSGHIQTIRFCQPYKFQNKSITDFGIKMCHSLMPIMPKTVSDFLHYKPSIRLWYIK